MLVESGGIVVAELELDDELDTELDTELDDDELGATLLKAGSDESPPPQPVRYDVTNNISSVAGKYQTNDTDSSRRFSRCEKSEFL